MKKIGSSCCLFPFCRDDNGPNGKPTGKFATKKKLIEDFKIARDQTINYVKTTGDPLKNHVARHPAFGELTTYQWLVFIAGHANRHVAQLEEVKTNINFPKI